MVTTQLLIETKTTEGRTSIDYKGRESLETATAIVKILQKARPMIELGDAA